jgi:hypothetical protein
MMCGRKGEENECGAQSVGKEREYDVVSSPHGSLIQIETRRESVEQQTIKRCLQSTNKVVKGGREGRDFRLTRGRVLSMKNKRNSDSMLECTGTEK